MNIPAGLQMPAEQGNEFWLYQPALVVPLLWPWIGEKDMHAVQALGRQRMLQHFHHVVLDNAHIR